MKQIGLFCFSFIVRHFFFLHTFFSKDLWCYKESARWTLLYREYFFSSTLHCLFLTQMDTNIGLGWVGIAWMWCVNARACVAFFLSSQLSHFLSFLVTKGSPPFFFLSRLQCFVTTKDVTNVESGKQRPFLTADSFFWIMFLPRSVRWRCFFFGGNL